MRLIGSGAVIPQVVCAARRFVERDDGRHAGKMGNRPPFTLNRRLRCKAYGFRM